MIQYLTKKTALLEYDSTDQSPMPNEISKPKEKSLNKVTTRKSNRVRKAPVKYGHGLKSKQIKIKWLKY